jgi:hypothetical protein
LNLMWHSDLVVSGGGTMNRGSCVGCAVSAFSRDVGGGRTKPEGRLVLVECLPTLRNTDRQAPPGPCRARQANPYRVVDTIRNRNRRSG